MSRVRRCEWTVLNNCVTKMPSSLAKGFESAPLLTGGADQKLLTSEDVKMRLTG